MPYIHHVGWCTCYRTMAHAFVAISTISPSSVPLQRLLTSEVTRLPAPSVRTSSSISFSQTRFSDFLDYYFQLLGYLAARKERRVRFDSDTKERGLIASERAAEFKSYCGRERVVLRKRRTRLRVDQFHIIAQIGQGGYGEVFLARKQETGEICALKKMRKRTLFKMDEVCGLSVRLND